eukprot:3061090-Pleurochrysis_carterae.AAC.2
MRQCADAVLPPHRAQAKIRLRASGGTQSNARAPSALPGWAQIGREAAFLSSCALRAPWFANLCGNLIPSIVDARGAGGERA